MRYVSRRLGFFVVVLWAALTVNFLIPRLTPGNTASGVLAQAKGGLTASALKAEEIALGVNVHHGLISTYFTYLKNTLTGQLGTSAQGDSVTHEIVSHLPWTLGLVGVTTVFAFILGTLVGVFGAWRRGGRVDGMLAPFVFILSTFPVFFVGLLLIYVFAIKLGWLPQQGGYDTITFSSPEFTLSFIWDVIKHAILPGIALVTVTSGLWIYSMRNNMITTIAEDYVKMGRAKGLSTLRIMYDYAARNAILPNLTGFAMQLGYVLGGAIAIEVLFNYPGLGYLFYNSASEKDLAMMQGLFLFYTLAVLVCVLLADLAVGILDPRTRDA